MARHSRRARRASSAPEGSRRAHSRRARLKSRATDKSRSALYPPSDARPFQRSDPTGGAQGNRPYSGVGGSLSYRSCYLVRKPAFSCRTDLRSTRRNGVDIVNISTSIVLILGYLLGSIPFAYLLARRHRGIDLRLAGSGNVGAANLLRMTTKKIGVSAMALDVGKGIASVLVARQIDPGPTGPAVAGIAAVLGHIYPVWLGFRGGKGVATTCGVFSVLAPQATAIATLVFLALVWWTRYISLGSVAGSVMLAPLAYLFGAAEVTVIAAVIVAAIVVHRHRSNLRRVFAGIERRLGQSA
jgi:acyl phosphate:glycerol-3-phosphate acyltransferase